MDMRATVLASIKARLTQTTSPILWHFDNIATGDNIQKTNEFFDTFPQNERGMFEIEGQLWKLEARFEKDMSGWMTLVPIPKTKPVHQSVEDEHQTVRTLPEIIDWWKTHNPYMKGD